MKAYKVTVGYNEDFYGRSTTEKAEYFFDEEKAKKRYAEGIYYVERTKITTIFKDGTINVGWTGANFYEECLTEAGKNEKVELIKVEENRFRFEEIEII